MNKIEAVTTKLSTFTIMLESSISTY